MRGAPQVHPMTGTRIFLAMGRAHGGTMWRAPMTRHRCTRNNTSSGLPGYYTVEDSQSRGRSKHLSKQRATGQLWRSNRWASNTPCGGCACGMVVRGVDRRAPGAGSWRRLGAGERGSWFAYNSDAYLSHGRFPGRRSAGRRPPAAADRLARPCRSQGNSQNV